MPQRKNTSQCTHILYEWETFTEVEIRGKVRLYTDSPHSIILHRLDDLSAFPSIREALQTTKVYTTPVWYSGYLEKWFLSNGKPLPELPYKLR